MKLRSKNLAKKQTAQNFLEQSPDNFFGFFFTNTTGLDLPIRLNNNFEVECMSLDGVECAWVFFFLNLSELFYQ